VCRDRPRAVNPYVDRGGWIPWQDAGGTWHGKHMLADSRLMSAEGPPGAITPRPRQMTVELNGYRKWLAHYGPPHVAIGTKRLRPTAPGTNSYQKARPTLTRLQPATTNGYQKCAQHAFE